mmetsp:Transcript_8642/g.26008  ORF Transcript_8642/g.26008 Transcript_8642/m.26008 type:complete len:201 (-) Transcript_8642:851-1453(-)
MPPCLASAMRSEPTELGFAAEERLLRGARCARFPLAASNRAIFASFSFLALDWRNMGPAWASTLGIVTTRCPEVLERCALASDARTSAGSASLMTLLLMTTERYLGCTSRSMSDESRCRCTWSSKMMQPGFDSSSQWNSHLPWLHCWILPCSSRSRALSTASFCSASWSRSRGWRSFSRASFSAFCSAISSYILTRTSGV